MKLFFSAVVSVIVLVLEATVSYSAVIEGRVYLDANRNGRWDDGETGLPGVLVSDGSRVVATDASGRYRLDSNEARALLWIAVPRDHRPTASFCAGPTAARLRISVSCDSPSRTTSASSR